MSPFAFNLISNSPCLHIKESIWSRNGIDVSKEYCPFPSRLILSFISVSFVFLAILAVLIFCLLYHLPVFQSYPAMFFSTYNNENGRLTRQTTFFKTLRKIVFSPGVPTVTLRQPFTIPFMFLTSTPFFKSLSYIPSGSLALNNIKFASDGYGLMLSNFDSSLKSLFLSETIDFIYKFLSFLFFKTSRAIFCDKELILNGSLTLLTSQIIFSSPIRKPTLNPASPILLSVLMITRFL